jgi:3-oxoacyl-[acyl-carrier-protein] synthase II
METLAHARQRGAQILAVLRGWAMTNDASHPTAPQKDGMWLACCMQRALEMAECGIDEVGYVNAHGTGTPLNDIAETHAYELVFQGRRNPIPVSSTKSYFGHCLGAAGALEAAITITAMREGALFPTLRLTDPIESAQVDWLRGALRREPLTTAISVSAGFGGSNAALVFGSECA